MQTHDPDRIAALFLDGGADAVGISVPDLDTIDVVDIARLDRLPFADDAFGGRLLAQQLDPSTDESSRRPAHRRAQLAALAAALPGGSLRSVLHPGCGPGLYVSDLRKYGVTAYHGIDAARRVIEHARTVAPDFGFTVGDIREVTNPEPVDAVLMTYEVPNFFPADELKTVLSIHTRHIRPGGHAILDMRLRETGTAEFDDGRRASVEKESLFCAEPHTLLVEGFARPEAGITGHRMMVLPVSGDQPYAVFHSILWLYWLPEIGELLDACGLDLQRVVQPFGDTTDRALQAHLLIACKR